MREEKQREVEMADLFVMNHTPSELKIAAEFFMNWLPFLTKNLCYNCTQTISNRVISLDLEFSGEVQALPLKEIHCDCVPDASIQDNCDTNSLGSWKDSAIGCSHHLPEASSQANWDTNSLGSWKDSAIGGSQHVAEKVSVQDNLNANFVVSCKDNTIDVSQHVVEKDFVKDNFDTNSLGSWKDSTIEGLEHVPEKAFVQDNSDTHSLGSWKDGVIGDSHVSEKASVQDLSFVKSPSTRMAWADMEEDEFEDDDMGEEDTNKQISAAEALSREQHEYLRFKMVKRKKHFNCMKWVDGARVNIVDGLELHTGVFSAAEQKRIVDFIYDIEAKGRRGELRERTFSAPEKWMPGKGRVTIQFGCCYNYAVLKDGSPPGILLDKLVDPLPDLFKVMIRRLVRWHVLPSICVPDSCIVNIYEEGDCMPPHIDHHDFLRPFCTVSFLSECDIVFGPKLKVVGPGQFSGAFPIPLPLGSVLVLNGNGADVAQHCVPAVPTKRISITFRKMDETKHPIWFVPEPDLQGLQPLPYDTDESKSMNLPKTPPQINRQTPIRSVYSEGRRFSGRGPNTTGRLNRQSLTISVDSEKRRVFSGRGSHSEPRYSGRTFFIPESDWKGLLPSPHDDESESMNTSPPQLSPQINRRSVTEEVDSEKGRGSSGRGSRPLHPYRSGWTSEPRYGQIRSQPSSRPRMRVSLGT